VVKNMNQLQKVKIKGGGGTILQSSIDYISDKNNKIYKNNTVMLTDGHTDKLNFKNIKTKILILSVGKKCPLSYDNGKIKQIIIKW